MKISPVGAPATAAPAPGTAPVSTRSFRMNTNATPGRLPEETENSAIPAEEQRETERAPEETQPLSPQLALLAKQKRALQLERQAFEREKAEHAAGKPQGDVVTLADLKRDPMGWIQKAGLTYDDLIPFVTGDVDKSAAKIAELQEQIASLKGDLDKRFTDERTTQEQQALAAMQREAAQIADAAGDTFAAIRDKKAAPQVAKLIEAIYHKDGTVLDVREAMQLVETELREDLKKESALLQRLGLFAPPQPPPQQRSSGMRTLTNRDAASATPVVDRRARALQAWSQNQTRR